jgi:hypothetical protein
MRHLQLSKHLYRNQQAVPVVKQVNLAIGAASHTLLVRRLQLVALTKSTPKVKFAVESEREAVYPIKTVSKTQSLETLNLLQVITKQLADNNIVQLTQPAIKNNDYRLRLIRCNLTDTMRQLNDRLADFDFDPFTVNAQIKLSNSTANKHEALLRLAGLPLRVGHTV